MAQNIILKEGGGQPIFFYLLGGSQQLWPSLGGYKPGSGILGGVRVSLPLAVIQLVIDFNLFGGHKPFYEYYKCLNHKKVKL